ncbi:hypothetical protein Pan54_17880 [Rubinisphaera italica]|uniref:PilZ domain-containing protein n=2 Tax=Rubinisphaera italica TaxID=2527969 RepID=A0A5C5XE35_9PLAN|nr:hypothetical protein Pan54_17880 [Rubinisphaera italica]
MSIMQNSRGSQRKAEWMNRSAEMDKRSESRIDVAFDIRVTPLDHQMVSTDFSFTARLLNYSATGACIQHRELIVEPFVQIEWQAKHKVHKGIVRLKWCRATGNKCYLTGGRVVSMESFEIPEELCM